MNREQRRREKRKMAHSQVSPNMQQVKIDTNQLKERTCVCGSNLFTTGLSLREVPAFVSPTGKPETYMQHICFICAACGAILPLTPEAAAEPESDGRRTIEVVKR